MEVRTLVAFCQQPGFSQNRGEGCGIQGVLPTSVIQVGIPLYMKNIVFGVRPFLLYHRSGFHSPQPCSSLFGNCRQEICTARGHAHSIRSNRDPPGTRQCQTPKRNSARRGGWGVGGVGGLRFGGLRGWGAGGWGWGGLIKSREPFLFGVYHKRAQVAHQGTFTGNLQVSILELEIENSRISVWTPCHSDSAVAGQVPS